MWRNAGFTIEMGEHSDILDSTNHVVGIVSHAGYKKHGVGFTVDSVLSGHSQTGPIRL